MQQCLRKYLNTHNPVLVEALFKTEESSGTAVRSIYIIICHN